MDAAARPKRDLPMDIIEEIMLNLPVKSLIRFRCVSRSWNSKISEPSFIRKHLARATRKRLQLVIIHHDSLQDRIQTAYSCTLSSISSGQPLKDATNLICPFQGNPNSNVKLRAFCDELLCVQVDDSMFLWNPSIRTYKQIPAPPPANCKYCHPYGMGYDSAGDDYKVLKVPCFHEDLVLERERTHRVETQLYSLRSDAWRTIQPFPGRTEPYATGIVMKGAVHWFVYSSRNASASAIVSFNLSTEKYGEVPQPQYSPILGVVDFVDITVLNGMLCVYMNCKENGLVFWVMKEYGDEKSWTKIYEIGYSNITTSIMKPGLVPLYLFEDGEVLIFAIPLLEVLELPPYEEKQPEILIYNGKQTTVRTTVDCPRGDLFSEEFNYVESLIYVESLVSPTFYPRSNVLARA